MLGFPPLTHALEYIFHYIRSPDMLGYKGIWGVQRDTAGYSGIRRDTTGYNEIKQDTVGYSGIQRDTAGYSGIQRDRGDTAGYSGMPWDTAGCSRIQRDTIKIYSRAHGCLPNHGSLVLVPSPRFLAPSRPRVPPPPFPFSCVVRCDLWVLCY